MTDAMTAMAHREFESRNETGVRQTVAEAQQKMRMNDPRVEGNIDVEMTQKTQYWNKIEETLDNEILNCIKVLKEYTEQEVDSKLFNNVLARLSELEHARKTMTKYFTGHAWTGWTSKMLVDPAI